MAGLLTNEEAKLVNTMTEGDYLATPAEQLELFEHWNRSRRWGLEQNLEALGPPPEAKIYGPNCATVLDVSIQDPKHTFGEAWHCLRSNWQIRRHAGSPEELLGDDIMLRSPLDWEWKNGLRWVVLNLGVPQLLVEPGMFNVNRDTSAPQALLWLVAFSPRWIKERLNYGPFLAFIGYQFAGGYEEERQYLDLMVWNYGERDICAEWHGISEDRPRANTKHGHGLLIPCRVRF
jgi:hypothetical protein